MKKRIIIVALIALMALALCGCCLKHDYAPATCTNPETCAKCGKTKGTALGHTWVEATCTDPKTCKTCGETEGEALGHEWVEATCTEPKTCSVCGATEGEALGHEWVEATCTEPKTCSICGATEGEPAEHEWTEATLTEPKTCTVCGLTEGKPLKDETAAVINGKEYSVADMNYEYMKSYASFLQTYGAYASLFGFDTSADPAEQEYAEGQTWKDLFLDDAVNSIKVMDKLADYAKEKGLEATEEERAQLEEYINSYETSLTEAGYASFDDALAELYGPGVTKEMIIEDNVRSLLAQKAYAAKAQELAESVTDEEIQEKPAVDVRHVLLQAKADDEGNFSEEALTTAKKRAEAVMRIFERGEKTEEAFAALAGLYSEDAGSSENGGLYEGVQKGQMVEEFDAFCFDPERQPGDTAIVHGTNGAYDGYHVMYFVGANDEAAKNSIAESKLDDWYNSLIDDTEIEKTEYFEKIG